MKKLDKQELEYIKQQAILVFIPIAIGLAMFTVFLFFFAR